MMTNFFFVKTTDPVSYTRINVEDVVHVKSVSGKVEITLTDQKIVLNKKLIDLEARLHELGIVRVSRDTMVPIFKIKQILNNEVHLVTPNSEIIKISRQYKKELVDQCRVYMLAP